MLHYRFQAEFCNPASGNEKGNVENKVGYSRRNAFVPVPTIISFDEFNKHLWDWCEKDARRDHYVHKVPIQELYEKDEKVLLALPQHPYQVFRYESLKVDKYGFAVVDTNKYGLDPMLNGEVVQAKIYYDKIEFFIVISPQAAFAGVMGRMKKPMTGPNIFLFCARNPARLRMPAFSGRFQILFDAESNMTLMILFYGRFSNGLGCRRTRGSIKTS